MHRHDSEWLERNRCLRGFLYSAHSPLMASLWTQHGNNALKREHTFLPSCCSGVTPCYLTAAQAKQHMVSYGMQSYSLSLSLLQTLPFCAPVMLANVCAYVQAQRPTANQGNTSFPPFASAADACCCSACKCLCLCAGTRPYSQPGQCIVSAFCKCCSVMLLLSSLICSQTLA